MGPIKVRVRKVIDLKINERSLLSVNSSQVSKSRQTAHNISHSGATVF